MHLKLHQSHIKKESHITVSGSKSESNRLLLLQALYPKINISNLSDSDDSHVMQKGLSGHFDVVDIHHAGTAMRFLTAYFAMQAQKEVVLTGSERMKERPIKILVDALKNLGADITYMENDGCPPLKILGKELVKDKVTLNAHVSSQYISALLLVAPKLKNGLELTLKGEITSVPYIKMTLSLLEQIGVDTTFKDNIITVTPKPSLDKTIDSIVESDWSSASYFYSIVAMSSMGTKITLSSYKENSLQGDSELASIYQQFGVQTSFKKNTITLEKISEVTLEKDIELNLVNCPDIAQTITVTCLGLGLSCYLSGLHTLRIKETDRLQALKTEIKKLGGHINITDNSLKLHASNKLIRNIEINTYNDHRMAMAFAPLALKTDILIKNAYVVTKSYKAFWDDLKTLGFKISQ
ncbi:3-phosphoshikimate 1-carboxyvinyltransferase [Mangrovimonas spongiae]|uniref:3-phosphoshikimate 1-carboxyvinyltransferase n=1 Tax=Mangrovimonas spongiae TaxID=2494697 RepID=A0A3R9UTR0_9FLAO|nr:3-phosphoshikimate 1-carboxyvinyltransferase [Mangrovimonas spongiae]RSK39921.1 3-phosphoshikimate 1-carboxyvinyltransferase [Mangrovimonas spongiae]